MAGPAASSSSRCGMVEEMLIVSGLVGAQIIFAIYIVFLHQFLELGVSSLSLIMYGGLASALFLLPFAVVLERKRWPSAIRPMLMVQVLTIAVSGILFQVLMLLGVKMTSPAIASAMPNLAPVMIFIIAACVRFEKFSIGCKYTRAKVAGTILCLGGATAMSFLMSPPAARNRLNASAVGSISKEWILGSSCLFAAVVFLSCTTVLQAVTMINFQAPLTLCAITTLMGSIFTAAAQLAIEGNLNVGSSSLSFKTIISLVLLGSVVTSVCVGFQTWCVKKKGPVMVSIFSPVQTVCSATLSAFILGQVISLGSLTGMLIMFGGLYIVLWAKKKEDSDITNNNDIEKPLLS